MQNSNIHLYPLPPQMVISFSIYFSISLVCCRLVFVGLISIYYSNANWNCRILHDLQLIFQIMIAFILLSSSTKGFQCDNGTKPIIYSQREMLFDYGLSENLQCQSPIIIFQLVGLFQLCSDVYHLLHLVELALSTVDGPPISRKYSFFWGLGGRRYFHVV